MQQVSKIFEFLLDVFDILKPTLLACNKRERYQNFFTALVERLLQVEDHIKVIVRMNQVLCLRDGLRDDAGQVHNYTAIAR